MEESPGTDREFIWRAHPARERPGATLVLVSVLAGILVSVWLAFADPVLLLLSTAILGASLSPWFFPTTFRLDATGASARRAGMSRVRRWEEIRGVHVDRHGATLSPFAKTSWLEPYRALRLLFSGNRAEVVALLEEYLPERCQIPTDPTLGGATRKPTTTGS
jgi:hypothetical protein